MGITLKTNPLDEHPDQLYPFLSSSIQLFPWYIQLNSGVKPGDSMCSDRCDVRSVSRDAVRMLGMFVAGDRLCRPF